MTLNGFAQCAEQPLLLVRSSPSFSPAFPPAFSPAFPPAFLSFFLLHRNSHSNTTGHFGKVYLARLKGEESFVLALKCLDRKAIENSPGVERQVRREIEIMMNLR